MKVLFVCGKARMRSPTAADLAARRAGVEADFAGLSKDADEHLSSEHIAWADVIAVMETRQKKRLNALWGTALKAKRVVVLGVPDIYAYMQPELVDLLDSKLERLLRGA